MRPVWKGTISFGLVSIPVSLISAEQKTELKFNLLDSKDSSRIRYERVNEETGEEVPWDRIVKGYEYKEGSYVLLTDADFEKVQVEATKSIDIEAFITQEELNPMSLETPYYIVPNKGGEKPYVLLREVLQKSGKIGIARVVIRTKEYLAAVYPYMDALVLNLVRFYNEIRNPNALELPETAKISAKEVDLAMKLIDNMTEKWDPSEYKNEYSDALLKWIEEKAATGLDPVSGSESKKTSKKVVEDMMSLLEASINRRSSKTEARPAAKKAPPKTTKSSRK